MCSSEAYLSEKRYKKTAGINNLAVFGCMGFAVIISSEKAPPTPFDVVYENISTLRD